LGGRRPLGLLWVPTRRLALRFRLHPWLMWREKRTAHAEYLLRRKYHLLPLALVRRDQMDQMDRMDRMDRLEVDWVVTSFPPAVFYPFPSCWSGRAVGVEEYRREQVQNAGHWFGLPPVMVLERPRVELGRPQGAVGETCSRPGRWEQMVVTVRWPVLSWGDGEGCCEMELRVE
jgi:hypothetical protein